MKPYRHRKLTAAPDVGDIKDEGRKSSVGRVGKARGYNKPAAKRATRRNMKRADKAKTAREDRRNQNDIDGGILERMSW